LKNRPARQALHSALCQALGILQTDQRAADRRHFRTIGFTSDYLAASKQFHDINIHQIPALYKSEYASLIVLMIFSSSVLIYNSDCGIKSIFIDAKQLG
jgi:hypothetical protein